MSESNSALYRSFVERVATEVLPRAASANLPRDRAYIAGIMWAALEVTGDDVWRGRAEKQLQEVADDVESLARTLDASALLASHWPSVRLTKDKAARKQLVAAGEMIAETFQQSGKYFALAEDPSIIHIKSILAAPIVFYAAEETLEQELGRRATQHARTIRDTLVREDGSVLKSSNDQAADTHAAIIAVQGFLHCFEFSNQLEFQTVSRRVAEQGLDSAAATEFTRQDRAMAVAGLRGLSLVSDEAKLKTAFADRASELLSPNFVDALQISGDTDLSGLYWLASAAVKS